MHQEIDIIRDWLQGSAPIVIARVIQTWGSSPRPVGSVMVINQNEKMYGSVSGGCVEGEVVRSALSMIASGTTNAQTMEFGVSDELAWSSGLSCGGKLKILMQLIHADDKVWKSIGSKLDSNENIAIETKVKTGTTAFTELEHSQVESGLVVKNGEDYFIHIIPTKPKLVLIGIAHVTVDLVRFAKMFDFETIAIDPRGFFSENTPFDEKPDQIHTKYPSEVLETISLDESTYCAVLSHDPKIDDNALEILLKSDVGYIGALGSRKTHQRRIERLKKKGFSDDVLQNIRGPIGLDIGAVGAREIAFSIMGQVLATKNKVF